MVDTLEREEIDILFCVGGDGTQRGGELSVAASATSAPAAHVASSAEAATAEATSTETSTAVATAESPSAESSTHVAHRSAPIAHASHRGASEIRPAHWHAAHALPHRARRWHAAKSLARAHSANATALRKALRSHASHPALAAVERNATTLVSSGEASVHRPHTPAQAGLRAHGSDLSLPGQARSASRQRGPRRGVLKRIGINTIERGPERTIASSQA
jgi:hypothetical protein